MATAFMMFSKDELSRCAEGALVVFAHGKASGPWGTKITALAKRATQYGAAVISPDFSDLQSADSRVERLTNTLLPDHKRLLLVGSSMGGYVATVSSRIMEPAGLFLMAPAVGLPGYAVQQPCANVKFLSIVHGWRDNVVPVSNVIDFAKAHCAELHIIDAEHDLHDGLEKVEGYFFDFLISALR